MLRDEENRRMQYGSLIINSSYQKLPFGSGDDPDKLFFHHALNEVSNSSDGENFGALDSSEKTIPIQGDRWWPQTAKQEERVSLLGLGTMLRLERDPWSLVKRLG